MQRLKRVPAMWETWVRSLGQEDPLEKEMATHSSILAWSILGWRSLVGYSPRVTNSQTRLSDFTHFTYENLGNSILRGSDGKEIACNAGDLGSIPGSGRSPGEGSNTLQYSCLENSRDIGAWGGSGGLQSIGSQRVRQN